MLLPPMRDYWETATTYRRPEMPESFNYAAVIDDYGLDPAREALIWTNAAGDERRFTFREISRQSQKIARALSARGVGRGDRVLIMLPRVPEWQMTMLAVFRLGAVAIPCITMSQPKDLAYRIAATDAEGGHHDQQRDGEIRRSPRRRDRLAGPRLWRRAQARSLGGFRRSRRHRDRRPARRADVEGRSIHHLFHLRLDRHAEGGDAFGLFRAQLLRSVGLLVRSQRAEPRRHHVGDRRYRLVVLGDLHPHRPLARRRARLHP